MKTAHIPKKESTDLPSGHPFLAYITRNRWNAVRSKYGAIGFTELKAAFVVDAIEDYQRENPDAMVVDVASMCIKPALDQFYEKIWDELVDDCEALMLDAMGI